MLQFNVQLNADGVVRFKAVVPAVEAGLVGDWFEGKPYQPDERAVFERLPYRYRKAFTRAMKWWQTESMSGRSMPLKCELKTLRGKPMGSLFATPDWVTIPVERKSGGLTIGTSYFVSLAAAGQYYGDPNGNTAAEKVAAGEIHIGEPPLKPGERLRLDRSEGRYFIIEP